MPRTTETQSKPLQLVPRDEAVARQNALEMVDELRQRIVNGETLRFGLVETRVGEIWATSFSSGMHKREDGAMLIELGLRMLGFVSKDVDDNIR